MLKKLSKKREILLVGKYSGVRDIFHAQELPQLLYYSNHININSHVTVVLSML